MSSRGLSLGTWTPGSSQNVQLSPQVCGLRRENGSVGRTRGWTRKTRSWPEPTKGEGKGDSCNVEASRGHPGGLCGHICLTVTAIPGVSCGPGMHGQATEPWHSESSGWRAAVVLLWTGCLGQPIRVEPGAQTVGSWRAHREGATGLDRSHGANGTTALGPFSIA